MSNTRLISKDIEDFYNEASEEKRLNGGLGTLEFERVKKLIRKYLIIENARIIDVGGGTGKYSKWLSKKGHKVSLIEPVEKHLKLARKRASKLENPFEILKGEACKLAIEDNSVDMVILHGPLYHLQNKADRINAILEAKRVLKKNGVVLGFAINYAASTLVGLLQGLIHSESYFDMCKTELNSGKHNPPKEFPWLTIF